MKSRVILLVLLTFVLFSHALVPAEEVPLPKPNILTKETIYTSKRLSTYDNLLIKDFPIDQAEVSNISEKAMPQYETLKPKLVNLLSEELVRQLKSKKIFKQIQKGDQAAGNTLILEGKFTEINAGSRAARFWVGFGAGSSKVSVQGRLVDAANGKELAVFENNRHSPFSVADFERVLREDTKNQAVDIAAFLEKLY